MTKERTLIERNIELSAEFSRYLFEHPEVEERLPLGAEVVLLPEFTKEGIMEILNLQPKGAKAKPYQVKQVRAVIIKYRLGGSDNEQA